MGPYAMCLPANTHVISERNPVSYRVSARPITRLRPVAHRRPADTWASLPSHGDPDPGLERECHPIKDPLPHRPERTAKRSNCGATKTDTWLGAHSARSNSSRTRSTE